VGFDEGRNNHAARWLTTAGRVHLGFGGYQEPRRWARRPGGGTSYPGALALM
jgi:hypothetical protein